MSKNTVLNHLRTCVTMVLVALAIATGGTLAAQDPDAWEVRHNAYQPPERVMDAIGVEPGMVVAEVGAGRGRYVVHMARRVGRAGRIFANDIDAEALAYLRHRCSRDDIPNVETILGTVTDPRLPEGAVDIVYVINTYHHFDRPIELLQNILPSLKPDGVLAIVEHDPDKMGESGNHTTAQNLLMDQAYRAGFGLVRIETFLERDNINLFRPRQALASHGGHAHGDRERRGADGHRAHRHAHGHAHGHSSDHAGDGSDGHHHNHSPEHRRNVDLDRSRWMWQLPRQVMNAIDIQPGMVVADIGAGYGFFTFPLAERVGSGGHVYANDIDELALKDMQDRCRQQAIDNITTILGEPDDPRLPTGAIDLALIVNTIHLIEEPGDFLRKVRGDLKPGGTLVIVQWDADKMAAENDICDSDRQRYSREAVISRVTAAGFAVERTETFLPVQNIYICRAQ